MKKILLTVEEIQLLAFAMGAYIGELSLKEESGTMKKEDLAKHVETSMEIMNKLNNAEEEACLFFKGIII